MIFYAAMAVALTTGPAFIAALGLLGGDADAPSPMTVAHQLHDAIAAARLAVIPGAGHISNLEDPV